MLNVSLFWFCGLIVEFDLEFNREFLYNVFKHFPKEYSWTKIKAIDQDFNRKLFPILCKGSQSESCI